MEQLKVAPLFLTLSNQTSRTRNKTHSECQHHLLEVLVSHDPFFNGFDGVSGSERKVVCTNRLLQKTEKLGCQNTGHRHIPFLTAVDHVTDLHVEAPVFCYQAGTGSTLWKNMLININYMTYNTSVAKFCLVHDFHSLFKNLKINIDR